MKPTPEDIARDLRADLAELQAREGRQWDAWVLDSAYEGWSAALRRLIHLETVIRDVHSQIADDLCWMDVDRVFAAMGLPVPDRRVGDRFAMVKNCVRFVETMCQGGKWRSYAELEAENASLRRQIEGHCQRIAAQSDPLSRLAEKKA